MECAWAGPFPLTWLLTHVCAGIAFLLYRKYEILGSVDDLGRVGPAPVIDHALEQGFLQNLAVLVGIALAFGALVSAPAATLAARGDWKPTTMRLALASVAGALFYAVVQAIYQAMALYFRTVPHGSGFEREEVGYESFVFRAGVVFVIVIALALLVAAALGYVLAPRTSARRSHLALAGAGAVLVFVALTLPFVDFLNACNVGRPFVLDSSC